jgi:hypothetical protein
LPSGKNKLIAGALFGRRLQTSVVNPPGTALVFLSMTKYATTAKRSALAQEGLQRIHFL